MVALGEGVYQITIIAGAVGSSPRKVNVFEKKLLKLCKSNFENIIFCFIPNTVHLLRT